MLSRSFEIYIVDKVVFEVLKEAVSPGEIRDVLAQLPDDYDRLFDSSSIGATPPRED